MTEQHNELPRPFTTALTVCVGTFFGVIIALFIAMRVFFEIIRIFIP